MQCDVCGEHDRDPLREEVLSQNGWITFWVLLFVFFPLAWIPFVTMKEPRFKCRDCGSVMHPGRRPARRRRDEEDRDDDREEEDDREDSRRRRRR